MNEESVIVDIDEVERAFINACQKENSVLVQLHSLAAFDEEKYRELFELASRYYELLGKSKVMGREMAGYLHEFMFVLDKAMLSDFPRLKHPDIEKLREAHYEMWNLLNRIFLLADK